MKIFYFIFSISILVFLYGCKREDLGAYDPNYNGEWHTDSIFSGGKWLEKYFIIEGGQGVFVEWCELTPSGCSGGNVFSGKARINYRKKKFYIGEMFKKNGQIVLEIKEVPHVNSDGKWECTLGDKKYLKK